MIDKWSSGHKLLDEDAQRILYEIWYMSMLLWCTVQLRFGDKIVRVLPEHSTVDAAVVHSYLS